MLVNASTALAQEKNSGPLAFVHSDLNSNTLYWIQGRFVPVDNPKFQGDSEVATILCSVREYECPVFDGTATFRNLEQVWIDEFKITSWDKNEITGTSRSLDGCTDENLKIRFAPPTVVQINSPALPMSENCKKVNGAWDKLTGKNGSALKGQMDQYMLVPTRGLAPFQDVNSRSETKVPASSQKNP